MKQVDGQKNVFTMTITDRVLMQGLLPSEGNYITLKNSQAINDKLKFSTLEEEQCGMELKDSSLTWKKDLEKDIEFSASEIEFIQKVLTEKSEKNELKINVFPIAKIFLEDMDLATK